MQRYEMSVHELTEAELRLLPPERLARAAQYRFEKDRLLSLAAGVLLVRGLRELGLCAREVRIERGPHGKPFLPEHPDIHFSLTHSGERAAAVFSSRPVGCDLERVRPLRWPLAERCFQPDELALLRQSAQPEVDFCRLWTCRESFLKAVGTGLSAPTECVCVRLAPDGASLTQSLDPHRWQLFEFPRGDCRLAVCERLP